MPTVVDPFFHWYTGAAPPLVGVAVKVTGVPVAEHMAVEVLVMETEGVVKGLTSMVMLLLVVGLPVAQVALEVSLALTIWPVVRADVV